MKLKRSAGFFGFVREFVEFRRLARAAGPRLRLRWRDRYPCLHDRTATTGFDRHYVLHPAWAARLLARTKPDHHIDIASSLNFVTLVSAFLPVTFYDYRPAELRLDGLSSQRADLLALPFSDRSVPSLSCMHVVEHVGLGRYGDPLDAEGDLKAMRELQRVVAPGGSLFFVVPVGRPVIRFNAHRIYSFAQALAGFPELTLQEFALIPDDPAQGSLIVGAAPEMVDRQNYGCGCFWLRRPA